MEPLDSNWEAPILEDLQKPDCALQLALLKALDDGPKDSEQLNFCLDADSTSALAWVIERGLVQSGLRNDLKTRFYCLTILGMMVLSHFDGADVAAEARLIRLYRAAMRLLRNSKRALEWLAEPNARLHGTIPLQAVISEDATAEVEAEVFRIQHGVL